MVKWSDHRPVWPKRRLLTELLQSLTEATKRCDRAGRPMSHCLCPLSYRTGPATGRAGTARRQVEMAFGSGEEAKKRDEDPDTMISKYLSGVLRHNAVELGLEVRHDGYVAVSQAGRTCWRQHSLQVLELEFFKSKGLGEEES